jgi:hypothetical protein
MISDSVVGDVLLQQLLSPFVGEPGKEFGVLVDGFPRTALQVGGWVGGVGGTLVPGPSTCSSSSSSSFISWGRTQTAAVSSCQQ